MPGTPHRFANVDGDHYVTGIVPGAGIDWVFM